MSLSRYISRSTTTPPSPVIPDNAISTKTGYLMALVGGLLLTVDVPTIKLSGADTSTVIVFRGVFLFIGMFAYWFFFRREQVAFVNGYTSVLLAISGCISTILFINAISLTVVANVIFILAFMPMLSALLSRFFLGEHIGFATWTAIVFAMIGVLVIIGPELGGGNMVGNLFALGCALTNSAALTVIRHKKTDQSSAFSLGALMAALLYLPFASPWAMEASGWFWLGLNGLLLMPASTALLMLSPRYISAPSVAMFYLLESVLTPVWMWLIFTDTPKVSTLYGGIIIVTTLVIHSLYKQLRLGARRNQV